MILCRSARLAICDGTRLETAVPQPETDSPGWSAPSDEGQLKQQLARIRADAIDRLWLGMLVVALLGVPISIARSVNTGWLGLYTAHIVTGLFVVAVFVARHRLSPNLKVAALMLVFWTVGLAALGTLGLVGAGSLWLSLSALLMGALYSVRAGIATAGVAVVATVIAGIGFCQGWLSLSFDANAQVRSPASWAGLLFALSVMPLTVFAAVANLHRSTVNLLAEVHRQRELIRLMATRDPVTEGPTSRVAIDRLEQALVGAGRVGNRVALLFIDLDGFKLINDAHGHEAGDAVLKAVAERFRRALRPGDTVARVGGDEFIVVLERVDQAGTALAVGQGLIDALISPMRYESLEIPISASIGVALFPDHAATATELIRVADRAMYAAKRAGKSRISLHASA